MKLLTLVFLFISSLTFAQGTFTDKNMKWLNAPDKWSQEKNKLSIFPNPKTDFWRITFYGYTTDNGHFYYQESEGDFEVMVKVKGEYKDLYDQAGLMIRTDEKNWIKSGIEFVNEDINISAVYTREFSDWSVIEIKENPPALWLKLVRKNDSVELSYSLDGKDFKMQRLGYFPAKVKAMVGVMAAAPEGKGFNVSFEDFSLKPL